MSANATRDGTGVKKGRAATRRAARKRSAKVRRMPARLRRGVHMGGVGLRREDIYAR